MYITRIIERGRERRTEKEKGMEGVMERKRANGEASRQDRGRRREYYLRILSWYVFYISQCFHQKIVDHLRR